MKFLILLLIPILLNAKDPEAYQKAQRDKFHQTVAEADADLEKAKLKREKTVAKAAADYLEAIEKVKVYWTKKGDLEKALKSQKEAEMLKELLKGSKVDVGLNLGKKELKNIARDAKVEASSHYDHRFVPERVLDGIIHGKSSYEWATKGEGKGAWIKLKWAEMRTIHRVVLHDRPNTGDWITKGTLQLGGVSVKVGKLENNGGPTEIVLDKPVKSNWIKFRVEDAVGPNNGLSEIQVWGE